MLTEAEEIASALGMTLNKRMADLEARLDKRLRGIEKRPRGSGTGDDAPADLLRRITEALEAQGVMMAQILMLLNNRQKRSLEVHHADGSKSHIYEE
jgi:hypothetical protein